MGGTQPYELDSMPDPDGIKDAELIGLGNEGLRSMSVRVKGGDVVLVGGSRIDVSSHATSQAIVSVVAPDQKIRHYIAGSDGPYPIRQKELFTLNTGDVLLVGPNMITFKRTPHTVKLLFYIHAPNEPIALFRDGECFVGKHHNLDPKIFD